MPPGRTEANPSVQAWIWGSAPADAFPKDCKMLKVFSVTVMLSCSRPAAEQGLLEPLFTGNTELSPVTPSWPPVLWQ